MYRQQSMAVIEELGRLEATMPIPNSIPEATEAPELCVYVLNT